VVERRHAEAVIRALQAEGLLDPARKIVAGPEVTIPVRARGDLAALAQRVGARLVPDAEAPAREGRVAPRERVVALLRGRLEDRLLAQVPDKWEQHGDVLVLRMPDALLPAGREVAQAFAEVLGLKTVLHDPAGVAGELREMRAVPLLGDDPVALHVENGVRYRFDASRIMFSSGNLAERMRVAALPVEGETIVDMFAGIGYFTLPLAVHARPARIHALEKNPLSHRYLVENVALNGVAHVVEPWLGDNREFPREGIADRVLMGYFPRTQDFLPKALALLNPPGGTLHYHNTAHAESWKEEMEGQVRAACSAAGGTCEVADARVVKTHSPGVVHAVVEVRVKAGGSGGAAP